jgi:hypothetical protein
MASAAAVYAAQLIPKRHGMPLWQPEPTKFGEVLIGDVGFLDDGCFYRIFNATKPSDDPINKCCGIPADFTPLCYNETALRHTIDHYLPPGPLYSSSIARTEVKGGATG